MSLRRIASAAAAAAVLAVALPARADAPLHTGMRDARYCEILAVHRSGFSFSADVYNTFGLNDCPEATWKALDMGAIARELHAQKAIANGPRHFMVDAISLSQHGPPVDLDGLRLRKFATVAIDPRQLLHRRAYQENTVTRTTRYVYRAGRPMYELRDANGTTYVMQTYSLEIDPTLTAATLPSLGSRLKLPPGWRFETVVPQRDVEFDAHGTASVLQDDLQNSYQKVVR